MSTDENTATEYAARLAAERPAPEPAPQSWQEIHWSEWWAKRLTKPDGTKRRYRNKEDKAAAEAHEIAYRKQAYNTAHKDLAAKRAKARRARRSAQRANRLH